MTCSLNELIKKEPFRCACGKTHAAHLKDAAICGGAIEQTASFVKKFGAKKAYILADGNTYAAAGEKLISNLSKNGIGYSLFLFRDKTTEPDEKAVGSAVLNFDRSCDALISLGSGVINDITKILAADTSLPFISVATAPSMDGYASSTSSVIRNSLKVSVDSRCPDVIIGDLDVLAEAPLIMIQAGLGDMLAKYISVCEWRIGNIVTGEYYCEEVASLIRFALKKCVDNAQGILKRDKDAVKAVMEGLIISGIAADWAGVSRPVSGVEHYFSHIWDMRGLEFGTPVSLHGIQCGIGTLYALKGYEIIRSAVPDETKALGFFSSFDRDGWNKKLSEYIGKAADIMISDARSDGRNDPEKHRQRVKNIVSNWDKILGITETELPRRSEILSMLSSLGAPVKPEDIGLSSADIPMTFTATRDIRNKYILSALCFDLGISEETAYKLI